MLTAVFFQMAPPNQHLLAVGTRVSQNLSQAPKEELVRMLRTNGHNATQRNIRHGNILMICKNCDARCSVSTYKNDAWYVTKRHDAVGRQCQKSADAPTKKSQKRDAGKTPGRQREKSADAPIKKSQKQDAGKVTEAKRTSMLLLGGVWWCTVPRLNKIMYVVASRCVVAYGGVWWCMVYCVVACGGVWWCMVYSSAANVLFSSSDPEQSEIICQVCGFDIQKEQAHVMCKDSHSFCRNCFNHTVRSQVCESRAHFIALGCHLICPFCPATQIPPSFVFRQCAFVLEEAVYKLYEDCMTEKAVLETQQECAKQYAEKLKSLQEQCPKHPSQVERDQIAEILAYIGDNLILPRCPNAQCKKPFDDFDACAALKCEPDVGGCGIYFCAWCLQAQVGVADASGQVSTARSQCHAHVRCCSLNPTNNVYPPAPHPQVWNSVMNELARKRVKEYIAKSVPPQLQERVHADCQKQFPDIGLQRFGAVCSDGYRPVHPKRAHRNSGYEENITALMEMRLATRERAEQVLEVMQNNLERAIELRLSLSDSL
jgi:hypothetical protein